MKLHDKHYRLSRSSGFTLIELSVVMIVSSLMMISVLQYYVSYRAGEAIEATENSQSLLSGAIKQFFLTNNRYPCPSNPNLAPGDVNFGLEDCPATSLTVAVATGVDLDADGNDDQILIGSIPFQSLYNDRGMVPLTYASSLDGWGNKFTYAVTRNLTNQITYNKERGVIDIVDEFNQSILFPERRTHYILVSHGPNGYGSYAADGGQTEACAAIVIPPGTPPEFVTPNNERENCDGDDRFVKGLRRDGEFAPYDDYLKFYSQTDTQLWRMTGSTSAMNTNVGNVGIGTTAPLDKLHVAGGVRATRILATEVCAQSAAPGTCMPVDVLAGTRPSMLCPAGQAVTEIEGNQLRTHCVSYQVPTPAGQRCGTAPPEVMVGYDRGTNTIICAPRPPS